MWHKVQSEEQNRSTKLSESSQQAVRARTENLGQQKPTMSLKEGEYKIDHNKIQVRKVRAHLVSYRIEMSSKESKKGLGMFAQTRKSSKILESRSISFCL